MLRVTTLNKIDKDRKESLVDPRSLGLEVHEGFLTEGEEQSLLDLMSHNEGWCLKLYGRLYDHSTCSIVDKGAPPDWSPPLFSRVLSKLVLAPGTPPPEPLRVWSGRSIDPSGFTLYRPSERHQHQYAVILPLGVDRVQSFVRAGLEEWSFELKRRSLLIVRTFEGVGAELHDMPKKDGGDHFGAVIVFHKYC